VGEAAAASSTARPAGHGGTQGRERPCPPSPRHRSRKPSRHATYSLGVSHVTPQPLREPIRCVRRHTRQPWNPSGRGAVALRWGLKPPRPRCKLVTHNGPRKSLPAGPGEGRAKGRLLAFRGSRRPAPPGGNHEQASTFTSAFSRSRASCRSGSRGAKPPGGERSRPGFARSHRGPRGDRR
jgi:hypothetical protein